MRGGIALLLRVIQTGGTVTFLSKALRYSAEIEHTEHEILAIYYRFSFAASSIVHAVFCQAQVYTRLVCLRYILTERSTFIVLMCCAGLIA